MAEHTRFFVFDPAKREAAHDGDVKARFGPTNSQQGPRVFVLSRGGTLYMLFVGGVAQVEPATFGITMLAESPVPIGRGGEFLDGRICFGSGSDVCSYRVPAGDGG